MRIIQTFWSGRANPLGKTYGWAHAEYNLMSWALSCHYLRKHYEKVILYTDQRGYEILIERLHLPYTKVHVAYDDDLCLPKHWAYAKIKTYSMQSEPFLHIDGDVYVSQKFPTNITQRPLVAQNEEICTEYYSNMMRKITETPKICMPIYLQEEIEHKNISSCNMGIFGGNDLDFIHDYCQEVFAFFDTNHLNDPSEEQSKTDYNIFFEQIMLSMTAKKRKINIGYVLDSPIKDNGYTGRAFCDIEHAADHPFLHIIGGHKKNPKICEMLKNATIVQDMRLYKSILSLFPHKNERFGNAYKQEKLSLGIERFIASYENLINDKRREWEEIPEETISEWERTGANSLYAFNPPNDDEDYILSAHPCCFIYEIASTWPEEALGIIRQRLRKDKYFYLKGVLMSPCLEEKGIKETPLSSHEFHIITMAKSQNIKYKDVLQECLDSFGKNNGSVLLDAKLYIIGEIKELLRNGVLFLKKG